ncbi:hypothetical protein G9A89_000533 [Geosiphon pyriformis]|nr:hypothetical protein G9A89_000533 [Geosiphon pyriformis]
MKENENPIYDVRVFDSMHQARRRTRTQEQEMHHQKLLPLHSKHLLEDTELVLCDAAYERCPQQRNAYDCGLFAVAAVLHLLDGHTTTEDLFHQNDITNLRQHIYDSLSNGKQISWETMRTILPSLKQGEQHIDRMQPSIQDAETNSDVDTDSNSDEETDEEMDRKQPAIETDEEMDRKEPAVDDFNDFGHFLEMEEEPINEDDDDNTYDAYGGGQLFATKVTQEPEQSLQEHHDDFFIPFFSDRKYNTVKDIDHNMDEYEMISGFHFLIQKSTAISRQYRCRSHTGCIFVAPFGRKRGMNIIILKAKLTHPVHFGPKGPKPSDGCSPNQ